MRRKISLIRVIRIGLPHLVLIILCLFTAIPILWIISCSLQPEERLFEYPPHWIPSGLYLENFKKVLTETPIIRYMSNSVIIASLTALGVVFVSSFAAYAFARFKFPLRKTAFYGLLATQMMPALTNIIPLYMLLQVLRLLNTRTALIIVYTGVNLPLSIWIMTGFFQSLPIEVEEAAMIDGCNRFNIFTRIALPLALPGLAAVAILAFVMAWNEFVLALTFLSSQSLKPYQFGLYDIMVREMMQYQPHSLLNAAAVLGLIPSFIAYLFIQKGFMTGITRGAIK